MPSGSAFEHEIDFSGTPGVPPGSGIPDDKKPLAESRMAEIISSILDPEFTDLEAINRLIALEIAITLSDPGPHPYGRSMSDKVKALRDLAKTMQEGDNLSKKDFLNFDGPKFKYVLQELVTLFKASLKGSGFTEDVINHVLRIFRDSLLLREVDLRRETEKITHDSLFMNMASSPSNQETPAAQG